MKHIVYLLKIIISNFLLIISKIKNKKGLIILEYHRISNDIEYNDVHSIYPHEFYFQVNYLIKAGYEIVDLRDGINDLFSNNLKNRKAISLTFDDGHKDNILYAYPILKEFNISATMFIVSDYVGKKGWLDETGNLINYNKKNSQRWELLSWDELDIIKDHFNIESHSKSHKYLNKVTNNELYSEIIDPKAKITETLKKNVSIFCYPYGAFNSEVINSVKTFGYKAACSTEKGINNNKTDIYKLKRNEVGRGISKTQFCLLLSDAICSYDVISTLFNKIKK